jgi:ABC-2 type transport system ATP-binding protein
MTVVFSTHYLAEAEVSDRVVLLAHGRVVGSDTPAALKAMLGDEVIEIEGPDASRFLASLKNLVTVRVTIRTERGYRIGIAGRRDGLAELGGSASGLVRFTIRPATLDDVYFARTQVANAVEPSSTVAAGAASRT